MFDRETGVKAFACVMRAVYRECGSAGYRIAKLSGPNKNSGSSIERSNKLQIFNLIL